MSIQGNNIRAGNRSEFVIASFSALHPALTAPREREHGSASLLASTAGIGSAGDSPSRKVSAPEFS